ncbi:hypothetical protein BD769DRAFT_1362212 [Suillus cothurnatus]|nr:hypothetical protein BD769DRAFT_1362212 [Suillus cothurnatus]
MLYLIWHKDDSSTLESTNNLMTLHGKELKGMRSRFFECYHMLYFDLPPDMEHRQQVNHVTKNLIEYIEGSTILLASRTMLGECCLAAIQPKGFWTKLRAQERE